MAPPGGDNDLPPVAELLDNDNFATWKHAFSLAASSRGWMKYYTDPQYEHPRVALDAMTSVKTAVEFEATHRPTKPPQGLTEDERTAWIERYEAQRKYSKLGELHESISNDYRARASAYLLAAVSPSLQSNIRHLDSPYRMYTWLLDHFQAHDPLDLLSMLHNTTYQAPPSQLQTHFDHMEAMTAQLRRCILPASWTKLDVKAYDRQVWDALARLFLLHSFRSTSLDSIVEGLSYKSCSSLKEALSAMLSIPSNPIDPTPITPPATVPTTPPPPPHIRPPEPPASTSILPPSAPSAVPPTEASTSRPTIIPAQAPSLASTKPPIVAAAQPPTRIPAEVQSAGLAKPPIVASTQLSAPTTAAVTNPPSKEVPPPRPTASSPAEVAEKNKIAVAVAAEPSPLPPPLEIPKPKRKPDDPSRRPPKVNVPPLESPLNDNSWSIPKKAKPEVPPPVDKPVLARRSSASNIETTNGTPPTLAPVLARRASTSNLKQPRPHDVGDGVDAATGDNEAPNQFKRRRKKERASRWAPKTSPRLDIIQAEPLLAKPPPRPPNELILDLNHVAVDEAAVSRCIYISQINHSVTEVTLTVLCNPFGVEIDQSTSYPRIDVFMCQRTRRPRGDATVYFKSPEGAQAAMNLLNGKRVKNTMLKARPMDVATLRLLQVQIYDAKPFWTCAKCRVQVSCWRNRCQACSGPRTFSPNGVELSATDWLCKLYVYFKLYRRFTLES
ncbi:hypothetical protein LEN26_002111 [Aphanomyces euteiches]|nr:hypothetical protein LEN26_002111 [Aphanomyces euteiches]